MRIAAAFASALLVLGCAPITSVSTSQARIARGSGITLSLLGPDPAGIEHAISSALLQAGYPPFSGAIRAVVVTEPSRETQSEQEITRKYQTPYLCQVKTSGQGSRVYGFSLQVIEVASGRILVSINGASGDYSGQDIARALLEQLARLAG